MRTIISGQVSEETLQDAQLFAGIAPTSFVTNGEWTPPASDRPTDVFPVDPKLGVLGAAARDYTLCQHADAAIVVGGDDHLLRIAYQYGLLVHEA